MFNMDYNAPFNQTFSGYPFITFHHQDDFGSDNFHDTYQPCGVPNGLPTLAIPAMERFLQEIERPLFVPSITETDYHLTQPFPDPPQRPIAHVSDGGLSWFNDHRRSSPCNSGPESTYVSSKCSDRQDTPIASPHLLARSYSPAHGNSDAVQHACGGYSLSERPDSPPANSCVALHDVQNRADDVPDGIAVDIDPISYGSYGSYAQEGYQPIQSGDEETTTSGTTYSTPRSEYAPQDAPSRRSSDTPVIRRRRVQVRALSSPNQSRVSKRPAARRASSHRTYQPDDCSPPFASNRAFPCPFVIYGCPSTFGSKNEWKRHVSTQHMRLGFWRCDQCTTANGERKHNDFNRKDLFIQHVRRMHPDDPSYNRKTTKPKKEHCDEKSLQEAALRCYRPLRTPPQESRCVFCEHRFHGSGSWDDRMEHIGRHMEAKKKENELPTDPQDWCVDHQAEAWLLDERIVIDNGDHLELV